MKLYTYLIMGAVLSGLTACASFPDEQYPVQQGWRIAHLERTVGSAEALSTVDAQRDCRSLLPAAEAASQRWALVHFRRPPGLVDSVVPIDLDSGIQPGDAVYADVEHCAHALVPRLSH